MPRRNSQNSIKNLADLNNLAEIVVGKRAGQRASSKKNRRKRHYEKQFIRNSITHGLQSDQSEEHNLIEGLG